MPELQEIDRLIAGTPPAEAPEAAAGPSVQEIDRLIAAMPSSRAAVPPKTDLTGAMGTGVEGFQVGQVTPEAAATPRVLPSVPSQAEVMATQPGAQIPSATTTPEPIQIPTPPPVAAPAVPLQIPPVAPYEGPLPKLPDILTGPTPVGQAVSQALQAGVQSVTEGAKNITEGLTGFLTTARQTPEETFPGHKIRAARQIMDGLFNLGLAPFLAAGTGARELLREVNPGAESAEIVDPTTSAFVREMLGGGSPERTAESVAALRKPMTIGEVMELALTLGLPTMIHGKAPKRMEAAAAEVKPEAIREAAKPTQVPPPPPQIIPEVADVLRRAEEASQRAEAAVKQLEALTAKAKAPPPLEVPPEAKPAVPEAKPEVRTEVPPPPQEKPNLPLGRIVELARPTEPPQQAEVVPIPQVETSPPPRRPETPPPDEMAALRKELNPEEPAFRKTNRPEISPSPFTPLQEAIRRAWGEPGGTTAIEAARQGTLPLFLDAYQALPASLRGMWEQAGGFTPDAIWRTLRGDLSRLSPIQRTFLRRLGAEIAVPRGEFERPAFREASREAAPPFFSQLQREIDQRLPARATPEQIRNIVASGSVKADEVKWSGLEDYLAQLPAGQMVDKVTLQTFLRENEVQVEEIARGSNRQQQLDETDRRFREAASRDKRGLPERYLGTMGIHDLSLDVGRGDLPAEQLPVHLRGLGDALRFAYRRRETSREPETKFFRFTLPGGEQYRELLLTLPGRSEEAMRYPEPLTTLPEGYDPITDSSQPPNRRWGVTPPEQVSAKPWAGRHPTREAALDAALRQLNEQRNQQYADEWRAKNKGRIYRSPHWDEPNVLAHVRFDDRVDATGKKVLFIEELQSDWHQEGRRKGYQGGRSIEEIDRDMDANAAALEKVEPLGKQPRPIDSVAMWERHPELLARHQELQAERNAAQSGVPFAPFAKTWHELVLKRMLRWAAEHGYDTVAWTTGEQQAERYDLSKHLDRIKVERIGGPGETLYVITAWDKSDRVHNIGSHEAQNLPTVVGKDLADKITKQEPSVQVYQHLDLKIGGEGMRAFYDQIVPQFLNKYGKKWGARVGETTIRATNEVRPTGGFETPERLEAIRQQGAHGAKAVTERVPAIDITSEMRRSVVQEGQPMFMARRREGESDAAWGRRWLETFRMSANQGVGIEGLFLADTWTQMRGRELEAFARQASYLVPITREAKALFADLHAAIRRDFPDFTGADLFGFDTGFGESASLIPAGGLRGSTKPQMVLNPHSLLDEARGLAAAEGKAVLPIFGRQLRESMLHEFAHALTQSPDHDAVFDTTLTDLLQRYGAAGQAEINRLAATLRGYHYDRFASDTDRLSVSGVEPSGPSTGTGAPPGASPGAAFTQPEPPRPSGVAQSVEPTGSRPAGGMGGREGPLPTPPGPAGAGRPAGQEPSGVRGPEPARRDVVPSSEPSPDLTERVAQAGKQFPQEDFARWAESMREALGPGVEPYLRPAWDKIKGVEATAPGEAPPPAAEPAKSPFQAPPTPPVAEVPPPEEPPPLEEPRLRLEHHKAVVDAAGEMFERAGITRDKERWPVLSDQILDAMREGTLELPVMREVLQAHGLTLAEFGESMFRPAVKNAAQRLQMLSVLQRRLNRMAVEAGTGTEADALLSLAQQVETLRREGGDEAPLKELSWWRRADNIRRGLLVTQLATAVRNFETQVGRLGIDVLDQATQKVFGGKVADPWASWEAFADTFSQVRPTKGGLEARKASQAEIESLLQAFPKEWDRLFGSYSSDIARQAKEAGTPLNGVDRAFTQAEKIVNLLNFFNRFQEFAVRRSVFGADLGSRLERHGIDLEALAKGERRLSSEEWDAIAPDVKASVQKALEITFAQSAPYGSLGWHFTQFVNKAPVILTGPLPFPRFMVNSLKFLYDFSPMPLLKLMTSSERAKIAAGDRQMLSRASIGTAALLGAWLIREAQPDENKWYEMDVPGLGTTDIRPFNPFAAYFFLGDLAKRARTNTLYRTDWRDIVRGVASANVSGGLGLFALDKIIAGLGELAKPGKTMEAVSQAGGEVLSGLLVPLRTLTDLYAQFDPEWQVVRERRGEPFLGPAKAQFGVGEPQYVPTRSEPQKREQPALRQATGITAVTAKNDLERELDRFQFSRTEIQGPSTGDPVADNLIAKHMGQLAEGQTLPKINSLRYQGLSDPQRMEWLKVELSRIRAIARSAAKREDSELFKEVEAGKVPGRRRLLNEERAGQGLAPLKGQR